MRLPVPRPALSSRPVHRISLLHRRPMSSSYQLDSFLVTPAELSSSLQKNIHSRLSTAPRIIPLCGSWFMPNDPQSRTGHLSFAAGHIPRARFFDLDEIKDDQSPYPHMLPSAEDFATAMGKMGIRRDDSVVVYDSHELGIFSAPRVAWTLKVFGHPNVHVLNNYRLWVEQGFPVEKGEQDEVDEVDYPTPEMDEGKVVRFEELRERALEAGKEGAEEVVVLDARSKGRWEGTEPEPRAGLSSGHMPSSLSLPFSDLLDPNTKAFLPTEELKSVFQKLGVDGSIPIISSCGTGVTAAIVDAALEEAGFPDVNRRLYDGSWTEWAQRVEPRDNLIRMA